MLTEWRLASIVGYRVDANVLSSTQSTLHLKILSTCSFRTITFGLSLIQLKMLLFICLPTASAWIRFVGKGPHYDAIYKLRSVCFSTNSSNEASILSWSSIRGSRESSGSFIHPQNITGYVSDVEFFEQNGHVYVVICRYYDCALNKHDLGCLVMKITKENVKNV